MTIALSAGDYRLIIAPERGGSILEFAWRGEPLMRPARGATILDVACFPILPFCNRIANGRFAWEGREIGIAPNFPGSDHPHPLHGFGWLAEWEVLERMDHRIRLRHSVKGEVWPWAYEAEVDYSLDQNGLCVMLSLENQSDAPMPAGLGLHPYFPRTRETIYLGLHRGEWQNDADCLPLRLIENADARDWWNGAPVVTRAVDTVYTGSETPQLIEWPERNLSLTIEPSANLSFTTIYAPADTDWFCVEPQSQMTNALNWPNALSGIVVLCPGQVMEGGVSFKASRIAPATPAI